MLSIDITDTEVRAVWINTSGDRIKVRNAVRRDISPNVVVNGRIMDVFILAGEITELLTANNLPRQKTILCLNSGVILYKELMLPKPRQITQLLVEDLIMNEMGLSEAYNITYSIVDEITDENGTKIKVIASACPQELVNSYIELAAQLGVQLSKIVISSDGVSRVMDRRPVNSEESPFLLLQVDKKFININIYIDNGLVSSRYIMVDPADYEGNENCVNLAVFDNIFRIIHFFNSSDETEPIKHIGYYGIYDEASIESTLAQFNLPFTEFRRPFEVSSYQGFHFPPYVNAIAACYRTNSKLNDVNLLRSKEARNISKTRHFLAFAAGAAALFVAIVAGLTIYTNVLVGTRKNNLALLETQYQNLNHGQVIANVNAKKSAIDAFNIYIEQVERANAIVDFQHNMTPDIVTKIKAVMLPGMQISGDITVTGGKVTVSFTCNNDTSPTAYTEALIEQDYFQNIEYTGYTANEEGSYDFSLTMSIKGGNKFEA